MGTMDKKHMTDEKLEAEHDELRSRSPGSGSGSVSDTERRLAEAIRSEHELTFLQAVRQYPKSIGWSIFVSMGIIMVAFDPQVMGNLFSTPYFTQDFGHKYKDGYLVEASWQSGLLMGNPVGQVVGGLSVAYPMEWFGRRATFGAAVVLTGALIFLQFFARSLPVLLAGELLAGLVEGSFLVTVPAYISEVCPMALRGHLTSYVNLCFAAGQLIANGVTTATHKMDNHWAYSIPFAVQWVWVLVLLPGILFIPESPWWLVRKGRLDDAERSLKRLGFNRDKDGSSKGMLAFIVETDKLEREIDEGSTYLDCFKPANRRRTEISLGIYCSQTLSGIYLMGYSTFFFQQAGLSTDQSFDMSLGYMGLGLIGSFSSWITLVYFGRRSLYMYGLTILACLQYLIGILDCIPGRPKGAIWGESILLIIWNFFYDATIGPVVYILLTECSATRVRAKTIAAATAAQACMGIVMNVAIPYMINPEEANMQGKLGFFFGGIATVGLFWAYFRVPETKGRTYEELDLLFDKGVPARKFKDYVLEPTLLHE